MTSQNPTENDQKPDTTPPANVAPKDEKPDEPSEIKRELTDEEIAAVSGGLSPHQCPTFGG
jgi:hypothetical protein